MEFKIFLVLLMLGGVWSKNKFDIQEECNTGQEIEQCVDSFKEAVGIRKTEEDLCTDVHLTMSCLHDYVKEEFPDSDMMNDYLCKMRNFQDKIQTLCFTKSFGEEEGSGDEEAFKCLESIETYAQECAQLAVPKISKILQDQYAQGEELDMDSVKCLAMNLVLECTVDRMEELCPKEVVENLREGAEEAKDEIMKGVCDTVRYPEEVMK